MVFMFENLEDYQKAVDFVDRITDLTAQFAKGYYFLLDQLNRAALSVPANLAEGNGRFTKADRKNFFIIARGSTGACSSAGARAAQGPYLGRDRRWTS